MEMPLLGLGTALPPHCMSQDEAAELARQICCQTDEQARLLKVLYRKAGVEKRHTVVPYRTALNWMPSAVENSSTTSEAASRGPTTRERMQFYEEHATPLARQAAAEALHESGLGPQDITHLITVSCTGFTAPGVDVDLIKQLELRPTTERIQVGFMGCHGAINGLRAAQSIAAAEPRARVLLCAVELCSLHYRYQWEPERFMGNVLFADGAAALVGGGKDRAETNWNVRATGSCLLPDSADAMVWQLGDHGFEMSLSPRVPDLICEHLRPWLAHWLDHHGLDITQVGSWAVHPGGPRVLSAVEESLGLPREATAVSREVLAECGNMSSPTVLFILDRLRRRAAPRPCVALGFGPGLIAEAALLT